MAKPSRLFILSILAFILMASGSAGCAASDATPAVNFPNSGAATVQPAFLRGMVALHNFAFHTAVKDFRAALAIDRGFALAYWGEALSYAHFVWGDENVAAGRRVLRQEPAAVDPAKITPREQGYIDAAQALFGEGNRETREAAFADRMRALHAQYPDDVEAAVFYALALIRRGPQLGPAPVARRMQAAAILTALYKSNPRHPGVVHYLLHAYDDPVNAHLALPYARAYERIAMRSPHALHMPSHIYLRLGLWAGVARANANAYAASLEPKNAADGPDLHSLEWLHFARLQQGRLADAAKLLQTMRGYAAKGNAMAARAATRMATRTIYVTENWQQARAPKEGPYLDMFLSYPNAVYSAGVGAAVRGDEGAAARAAAELLRLRRPAIAAKLDTWAQRMDAMAAVVEAERAWHSGKMRDARGHFEKAIRITDALAGDVANADQSLPDPIKPVRELYGDMLLAAGDAAAAEAQFSAVLRRYPRRPAALFGLADALSASGHKKEAACRYAELSSIWRKADADMPGLAIVRRRTAGAANCAAASPN